MAVVNFPKYDKTKVISTDYRRKEMNFGEKLQMLRKEQNLSQEALAEKLEVSRQAVSKWENGVSQS